MSCNIKTKIEKISFGMHLSNTVLLMTQLKTICKTKVYLEKSQVFKAFCCFLTVVSFVNKIKFQRQILSRLFCQPAEFKFRKDACNYSNKQLNDTGNRTRKFNISFQ